MPNQTKRAGIIGLGSMGANVARRLLENKYELVLYNKTTDKYAPFQGVDGVHLSKDLKGFARRLGESAEPPLVWVMVPGGSVTNGVVRELAQLLKKGSIVIDASNSLYTDSIANHEALKRRGVSYLDVGCAGGPDDLLKGVSLMVGGEREAYDQAEALLKAVCGSGTYGYLGPSGSGHMAKLVHNIVFYGIFPVFSEGMELLLKLKGESPGLDTDEAFRLLAKSPPITDGIMKAISDTIRNGKLPEGEAQTIGISSMVASGTQKAEELEVSLSIIRAILAGYPTMSKDSKRIYGAAKKKLTGH
jgi:6-phosphogluconate dehydrogenase